MGFAVCRFLVAYWSILSSLFAVENKMASKWQCRLIPNDILRSVPTINMHFNILNSLVGDETNAADNKWENIRSNFFCLSFNICGEKT